MRTGAATGHRGYFHETAFYGSDDELVGIVEPFLLGGAEAGEPTLVALDERSAGVVRVALGDLPGMTSLPHATHYGRPAQTIRSYREAVERHVAAGAAQVRAVGTVPHPGLGASWDVWAPYEAAVHRALADMPLWGICPYDTRTTPDDVLAEAERMHPHVATADGGHRANLGFSDPATVVAERPPRPPDPIQVRPPAVELVQPTPSTARRSVRDLGRRSRVDRRSLDDLVIGVSEAVSNAWVHGRPPVRLQAWSAPDRLVVTVSDRGPGPGDPLVGLMPLPDRRRGGLGLWIAHQVCSEVALVVGDDGFTVRLTAREAA